MYATITITNDGRIAITVENDAGADFDTARAKLEALRRLLGDLPIQYTGEVERHIHDHTGAHVHAH